MASNGFAESKEGYEYKVRDMSESTIEFGRREYELAEVEMPGLMSCRSEFGAEQPLKDVAISGSLHMTIQTGVLIETLVALGAKVRWASCNIFSTQDHAAAAIVAAKSANVFAWKGMSTEDYWRCTEKMLTWKDTESGGPTLIVDDGGDATLLIHEGAKWEKKYRETKELPDPASAGKNEEFKWLLTILRESIQKNDSKWTKIAEGCQGVSEETTTGVHRLYQMAKANELAFPAINVNDSVTKSKFDNVYGCRHSLPDGIMRATDVMIAGKVAVVCGYGDVGKGSAASLKNAGARVLVTEIDPICALQACMEGFQVVRLKDVLHELDIVVTCTGNKDIVMLEDMKKMKNNAIICNIGHFDNEIDMAGVLEASHNIKRQNIKAQVDRFVFPENDYEKGVLILAEGRLVNLGCATGHPSFVMSNSFTNQVLAQIELKKSIGTNKYKNDVYILPKELDEKVAALHLDKLGAKLTILSDDQSEYIKVPKSGPYKPAHYRY